MQDLVPKLKPKKIRSQKLILDPNNPRFITKADEQIPEDQLADPAVVAATYQKMLDGDDYRITELMHSIETNGWQPVDSIFVRAYGNGLYVVLEGNRRVTAITELLKKTDLPTALRASIETLEVMEVHGLADPETRERQIAYLLGVRHHGSLKRWSPFAQARNIFSCYLERANIDNEDSFEWHSGIARQVADALSISSKEVEERMSVYRAMVSVSQVPAVGKSKIKDHYYSLFSELIKAKKGPLGKYIVQDARTLFFEPASAQKMDDLCEFSSGRANTPIVNPQEWRALGKILDDVEDKRAANLARVEKSREPPSVVWAQREEELRKLEWASWLNKVRGILGRVKMDQVDPDDAEAKIRIEKLRGVLAKLKGAQ